MVSSFGEKEAVLFCTSWPLFFFLFLDAKKGVGIPGIGFGYSSEGQIVCCYSCFLFFLASHLPFAFAMWAVLLSSTVFRYFISAIAYDTSDLLKWLSRRIGMPAKWWDMVEDCAEEVRSPDTKGRHISNFTTTADFLVLKWRMEKMHGFSSTQYKKK